MKSIKKKSLGQTSAFRNHALIALLALLFPALVVIAPGAAEESATPAEVVEKVKAAAAYLTAEGAGGVAAFKDPAGPWVWKDTYVWVLECARGTNAAHAIKPQLAGMSLMGIKDTGGKFFFAEFCKVAERPEGGWVEYQWPRVGEKTPSRKITYVLGAPGTPYQVAAGIYDETASLEELEKLIR